MFRTAGYPAHPSQFASYDYYQSPPRTPEQARDYQYYSPRQYVYATPTPKAHTRRATGDNTTYRFTSATHNTTPRKSSDYDIHHSSPGYYGSAPRKSDYVSGSERMQRYGGMHSSRAPADDGRKQQQQASPRKHSSGQKQYYSPQSRYVGNDHLNTSDPEDEYLPRYEQYEPRPPPYKRQTNSHHPEHRADPRYHAQVPIYTSATPADPIPRVRARRASHTATPTKPTPLRQPRPSTTPPSKQQQRQQQPPPPPTPATEADARRHGIPAGYSYKNWDASEEPILLLGSVFDANSLGKWIYDWTVFCHGAATPMCEVAGELWLLLIQLAGKIKRAEECVARIRQRASRDLVDDFLESGERLWQRFSRLLKLCEAYMWKAARKESGANGREKKVTMGKNSGCEFVESIFGRERELERTEKLMTGMRLWSMRFDANCEQILRHPDA